MAAPLRVTIVGGGLGGALMACSLGHAGHEVTLLEKRPDPRVKGFEGGRSINLALSVRGLTAMGKVGLAEKILAMALPMRGRTMHRPGAAATFQPYSSNPEDAIYSVSRGELNLALLEAAAECQSVTLEFDQTVTSVSIKTGEVTTAEKTVSSDLIIGADGAASVVRVALADAGMITTSTEFLDAGYKELSMPPGADGGFQLPNDTLHIWPRGGSMMIALPNLDGSFTCTLFWPRDGEGSFGALATGEAAESFIATHYPDVPQLIPDLAAQYDANPTGLLGTVRCSAYHGVGRVVLLGDAAHAIVPFFGQGMNAAFEDCRLMMGLLETSATASEAIEAFSGQRLGDCDAIADMALTNFIEMRDHVASPLFLLRRRWGRILHRLLPGLFTPLYEMVSFSNVPYAEALARSRRATLIGRVIAWSLIVILMAVGYFLVLG
jgi:kynurenine 3-monooxygenase